jgi:tetratricopeptide (TPR) repeat protein
MDGASVLEYKLGRFDHALKLSRQVLTQDPLSGAVWHNLGLISYSAGLLAESEKAFQRAMDLSPQRLVTTAMLALVRSSQGHAKDAIELAKREPDEFWRLWALAMLYHLSGDSDRSDRALAMILDEHSDGDGFQIAEIYAVRGEADKALEWLERSVAERDPGVTHLLPDPRFRSLHSDPRWSALLKKTGLDELRDDRETR